MSADFSGKGGGCGKRGRARGGPRGSQCIFIMSLACCIEPMLKQRKCFRKGVL